MGSVSLGGSGIGIIDKSRDVDEENVTYLERTKYKTLNMINGRAKSPEIIVTCENKHKTSEQ